MNSPPIDATLFLARVYLRTDVPRAIALLNRLRTSKGTPEQGWVAMFLGEGQALLDKYDSADAYFESALAIANKTHDRALRSHTAYRMGRRYIMANDPRKARQALRMMAQTATAETRLDALHLESFILSREGRLSEQAATLLELLRQIDPTSPRSMEHRAWATHTLAALAREMYLPEAVPEVERQLSGVPWPDDVLANRFQSLKALGWSKALSGDYFNAFRYISMSARIAPSDAWKTVAHCDKAYLAAVTGESKWSRQEILEAEELAQTVDWRHCENEEVIGLLLLSELLAPVDAARATEYLARYDTLRDSASARSLARRDPRSEAIRDYTAGVIEAALGDNKLAREKFKRSGDIYRSLRYDWRAARCEIQLYKLTQNRKYSENATDLLSQYSSSWLAHEVRHMERSHVRTGLPPMQERVFRYICDGFSNADIAEKLGRSENTVANHAKAVLKTFGVSNRPALIALALKRGLL